MKENKILTQIEQRELFYHKALGRQVTFKNQPDSNYSANGGRTLVDMDYGGRTWSSSKWIGVLDQDLDVVIDLEENSKVSQVKLSCISDNASGIYFPLNIEVLASTDGKSFRSIQKWDPNKDSKKKQQADPAIRKFSLSFEPTECRYIQLKAECLTLDHMGVFIFADEIIVL